MPGYYKFDYVIRNANDEIVDSSAGGEALSFVEGDGSTIQGLENALMGKSTGDEFKVTIGPDDAYGWSQRSLIRTVSKDMFDLDVDELKLGMVFQVGTGEDVEVVKVTGITDEGITIDANHPLAGITFNFDITVLEAREATPEELDSV
jgi:FKBP-type peptidyl-prolyl cis-trans isomerase SlyD